MCTYCVLSNCPFDVFLHIWSLNWQLHFDQCVRDDHVSCADVGRHDHIVQGGNPEYIARKNRIYSTKFLDIRNEHTASCHEKKMFMNKEHHMGDC